ncbi:MAG: hypothetical protein LBC42_01715 [Puniceicoccales bacterium]|nr:hypothetical protein [Puniceicoccales bacterium]
MGNAQPTNRELLEAFGSVRAELAALRADNERLVTAVAAVGERVDNVDTRVNNVDARVNEDRARNSAIIGGIVGGGAAVAVVIFLPSSLPAIVPAAIVLGGVVAGGGAAYGLDKGRDISVSRAVGNAAIKVREHFAAKGNPESMRTGIPPPV